MKLLYNIKFVTHQLRSLLSDDSNFFYLTCRMQGMIIKNVSVQIRAQTQHSVCYGTFWVDAKSLTSDQFIDKREACIAPSYPNHLPIHIKPVSHATCLNDVNLARHNNSNILLINLFAELPSIDVKCYASFHGKLPCHHSVSTSKVNVHRQCNLTTNVKFANHTK